MPDSFLTDLAAELADGEQALWLTANGISDRAFLRLVDEVIHWWPAALAELGEEDALGGVVGQAFQVGWEAARAAVPPGGGPANE